MRAAIVAVGSELLGTERLDTNSLRLTDVLERYGVDLVGKSVVGDDEDLLVAELLRRIDDSDLVLVTGGLGPTMDDRTRAATARALGRGITIDESIVEHIRRLFASFGRTMPEVNRRQAEVIDGATMLSNSRGSAPGMQLEHAGTHLFLLPGVPREVDAIVHDHVEPWLAARTDDAVRVERRTLKVACLPESDVEERIAPAYERFGRDALAVLSRPGEIRVVASTRGTAAERRAALDAMTEQLHDLIGPAVFTDNADDELEDVVGRLLRDRGLKLALAESCTGGGIGERITAVPGSSAYFEGGAVVYSYAAKSDLLGVDPNLIVERGAVSEEVAAAMARGARRRFRADLAIAVTGIAGPGGATDDKPVGTVHLAVAGPGDDDLEHRHVVFPGGRTRVRRMTSQMALEMLRRRLLAAVPDDALVQTAGATE
ncbi:MAG: competence/damage-inducible protein A [Acidobacteriota bacterium]